MANNYQLHNRVDNEEYAREVAQDMYDSGYYPAGLSPCFVSGINGDWADFGGICPFWGQEVCSCEEDGLRETFHEILESISLTPEQWHKMDSDEKVEYIENSTIGKIS